MVNTAEATAATREDPLESISDEAAIEFSAGFDDALGAGRSIEDAFGFGRNAIAQSAAAGRLARCVAVRQRDFPI